MVVYADIFTRIAIKETIVLKPNKLDQDYQSSVLQIIKERFEGICSHNGYIRPGSIELVAVTMGQVRAFSLNGDVEFGVQFKADVCSPCNGMLVMAKVVNINRLGIMAVVNSDGADKPILEIVIVRGFDGAKVDGTLVDPRIDAVQIGHVINVEVLGKRFQLNDKKISIIGRIVFEKIEDVKMSDPNAQDDDSAVFMEDVVEEDDEILTVDENSDSDKDDDDESELDVDDEAIDDDFDDVKSESSIED